MFRNYIKTAWRSIFRNKLLSVINIGGLAIGIAAVFFIAIYLDNQTSYDSFNKNKNSLYRVGFSHFKNKELVSDAHDFVPPFAPEAKSYFPEIKEYCRISPFHEAYVGIGEQSIKLKDIDYVDESFFRLFSFRLLSGNSNQVLMRPFSIVLSASTAKKLFGKDNPVGRTVYLDGDQQYLVTGIVEDAPNNSSFHFSSLVSLNTLFTDTVTNKMGWNGGNAYQTFFQLQPGTDITTLEKKFPKFMWEKINHEYQGYGIRIDAYLQPLTRLHLYYDGNATTLRNNLSVFSIIALLILIIAGANYINMSTAMSTFRYKEVGVRKVLGASRSELMFQFISESLLVSLFSICIAMMLVTVLMPLFRQVTGNDVALLSIGWWKLLLFAIIMLLCIGIGAGSYLAFYLSSLHVSKIIKSATGVKGRSYLGKVLILLQFVFTIALIGCTVVISTQLKYTQSRPIGMDRRQVLVFPLTGDKVQQFGNLFRQKVSAIGMVENASLVSEVPVDGITSNGFLPEGSKEIAFFHQLDADEHFLSTMKITLSRGTFFSSEKLSEIDGYVVNEALVRQMNWDNAIGKTIERDGVHKVIGVVKDFNYASMHDKVEPLVITSKPWRDQYSYLIVKYSGNQPSSLVNDVKIVWSQLFPQAPFDYMFMDEAYNQLYKNEIKFRQLFSVGTALAVLLSFSGIFGLVTLTVLQRTKEMGIRKVLGADTGDIVKLISAVYLKLIAMSGLVGIPLGWLYARSWLDSFAFRIPLHIGYFVFSLMSVLILALVVVVAKTWRTAGDNPVNSLRSE